MGFKVEVLCWVYVVSRVSLVANQMENRQRETGVVWVLCGEICFFPEIDPKPSTLHPEP